MFRKNKAAKEEMSKLDKVYGAIFGQRMPGFFVSDVSEEPEEYSRIKEAGERINKLENRTRDMNNVLGELLSGNKNIKIVSRDTYNNNEDLFTGFGVKRCLGEDNLLLVKGYKDED